MKKKYFKIFGWVCCSFLLWSCGHSQGTLSDAVLPSSSVVNTDSDAGTDSETTLPAPSESKPTPVPTPVVAKEFDTLAQRLSVDASYVSPLSSDWKKTFSAQLSLTSTEIQDLYAAGTFDGIFRLEKEDQLDWFDSLPRVYVDPWFLTGCKFCTVIKRNSLGSRKYFLTGDASAPSEVNGLGARPATAFDPVNKNYLIVWDEATADGGSSIYAKLVSEDGVTIRVDRKQISTPRPTQGCLFANFAQQTGLTAPTDCKKNVDPSVAYNDGHFLVTWTEQINAVKPVGQTMSVILGKMILSNTLAPLSSSWDEGIMLSKIRYASTDPDQEARNDNEVQAWSQNEHSALAPFFGTGTTGRGAFILVWDTTRDFISCVTADRRNATSIYGRMIPVSFSPITGNTDIFMISTDPSYGQPKCAPNSDVTSARKPRVASLKATGQFLTVFEISKNVPASPPSIMTSLMTASNDLSIAWGAPLGFGAMNEELYDPDVAATSDRFLVVNSVGNSALELTPVIPAADGINLTLGTSKTYTGPDGVNTSRPRIVVNRVMGNEAGTHDFPLEYVVAYEARPSSGGSNVSEIQVASFNEVLASIDPKAVLAAPGFSTNISPALASAEKKALVVWNAIKSGEGRIFDSVVTVDQPLNRAPTAVIEVIGHPENPAVVASSEAVVLSGESSSDPDGDVLSYQWRFVSGPTVTLSGTTSSKITFTAPRVDTVQDIVIELIVKDTRQSASRAVQKTIKVQPSVNQKPTAAIEVTGHPIDPVEVASGENVQLSGDGSRDPEDGTNLTYAWSQVGGPSVALNNSASSHATFTAPVIPEGNADQNITIQLVVKDTRNLASNPVQKTIKVKAQPHINQKPVAMIDVVGHPTEPMEVAAGENVELSADRSRDSDGSVRTYAWSQIPGGPAIALNGASASHATFTAPTLPPGTSPQNITIQLVVNDDLGLASDPVQKTITIKPLPPINRAPTAVITVIGHENENPPVVTVGTLVALSGTSSSDPDGQIDSPFVYHWRQTAGSTPPIALMNGGTATPYFTAPTVSTPANISIDLWVTDARGLDSPVVNKTIRVNPLPNNPPRAKITLLGETAPITTLMVDDSSADVVMDASGNPSWPRTRVTLSGAASDNGEAPPQQVQDYTWIQVGATTQTAIDATSNPTPAEFSFIVPDVTPEQGSATITIRLTVNDGGWNASTASQDIVITVNAVNHRPTAPVLLGPATGLIQPPSRALLTWQESTDPDVAAEGDQLVYDVYFGAQNPPTSTFANCVGTTQPRCIIDSLAPSTNYYWQVRVRDRASEALPSLSSGINNLGTDNSVLARWSFDDGPNGLCAGEPESQRGKKVCDKSGNGWNLVIYSASEGLTPHWLQNGDVFLNQTLSGILGIALGFGDNEYAVNASPINNTSAASIEFWMWVSRLIPGKRQSMYDSMNVDAGGITNNHIKRILVQLDGDTGLIDFILNGSNDANNNLVLTSTTPLSTNSWNHVICSFGPSGRKIYINGFLTSSGVGSISLGNYQGQTIMGWNPLSQGTLYPPEYYFGVFDEVVVYNQNLSQDFIDQLFNSR